TRASEWTVTRVPSQTASRGMLGIGRSPSLDADVTEYSWASSGAPPSEGPPAGDSSAAALARGPSPLRDPASVPRTPSRGIAAGPVNSPPVPVSSPGQPDRPSSGLAGSAPGPGRRPLGSAGSAPCPFRPAPSSPEAVTSTPDAPSPGTWVAEGSSLQSR